MFMPGWYTQCVCVVICSPGWKQRRSPTDTDVLPGLGYLMMFGLFAHVYIGLHNTACKTQLNST